MINLKEAQEKLKESSIEEIQTETAWKWAGFALAAYGFAMSESDNATSWFLDAEEYYHEAIEHAALIEQKNPHVLKEIQKQLAPLREKIHAKLK